MRHPMFCGSKKKYRIEGWRYLWTLDMLSIKMSGQGKWIWLKKSIIHRVTV